MYYVAFYLVIKILLIQNCKTILFCVTILASQYYNNLFIIKCMCYSKI